MPGTSVQKADGNSLVGGVAIDYEAVLKTLNLNPRDPATQALVLTCERYGLDPVLKHMVLIQSTPYVTHKGLWHIAHRSGELDGEEVLNQGETEREWFATVGIYRKGWAHPITMTGRYPKSSSNKHYGPEMAVVRAECLVLRRLFDVAVPVQEERDWERESTPAPPRATERAIEPAKPVTEDGELVAPYGLHDEPVDRPRSTRRPPPSQGRRPAPQTSAASEPADDAVSATAPADEASAGGGDRDAAPPLAAHLADAAVVEDLKRRMNALGPIERKECKTRFADSFGKPDELRVEHQGEAIALVEFYEPEGAS